jgi:hypothetical protein
MVTIWKKDMKGAYIMKSKLIILLLTLAFISNTVGCNSKANNEIPASTKDNKKEEIRITKFPYPSNFQRGSVNSLEDIKDNSGKMTSDLRGYNLEKVELTKEKGKLLNSVFDSKTKWPEKLPEGFNPESFLEFHKNPGFGLKKLHEKGITGKGINIAFIDYALLVNHQEYYDRVKMYEEIHYAQQEAQMHAPAVASIAAGKNTGVAPEADIYFIGSENYNVVNNKMEMDFTYTSKAIERIIEINKTLPKEDKIRVLSISAGCQPGNKGYEEFIEAIKKAMKDNIFVITVNAFEAYNDKFYFYGLDSDSLTDKDDISSYKPTEWKKWLSKVEHIDRLDKYYEEKINKDKPKEQLLIPIDAKTVASPTGEKDYVFYREGGWSWCMPYIAGLYALACQVKPDITPEEFWKKALETGDSKQIENYSGKIINPGRLIEELS